MRRQTKRVAASDYRTALLESRRRQLELTADNLRRMERTFDRAVQAIAAQIEHIPGHMLGEGEALQQEYLRLMLAEVEAALAEFRSDYAAELGYSMTDLAQAAAERQRRLDTLAGSTGDPRLLSDIERTYAVGGSEMTIRFGRLAHDAVERLTTRYYRDGLCLSDRLYNLDTATRKFVEDTLVQGLMAGETMGQVAGRMEENLSAAGSANPRYDAMRIARTEINSAYTEASVQGCVDPATGQIKTYIHAVGWRLSSSHPEPDICDIWAAHDEGLGAGNYMPAGIPGDHPHGLCFTVPVLAAYPELTGAHVSDPDPNAVPDSQIRYYAEQGDRAASAALARRA
jgi:hypothetical protein